MSAYAFITYDVSDAETYAQYSPGGLPTIRATVTRHGGKVIVAGGENTWLEGARKALVVIEFPTTAAALAWEEDPDYAPLRAIRLKSTTNVVEVIAPAFVPPAG